MDGLQTDIFQDVELDFEEDFEEDLLEEEFDAIEQSWQDEVNSSQESILSQEPSSGSTYQPSQPPELVRDEVEIFYKRNAVKYWRSGKTKRIKLENVLKRFPRLKNIMNIYRWVDQVDAQGARMDKLKKIGEITLNKFRNARSNRFIVHDDHIRRFAVQANVDVKVDGFKASAT